MLKEKYNKVFDKNGEIKVCGRDACKNLIQECERKFGENIDFGNADTGMMNVEIIQKYIQEMEENQQ